MNPWAPTSPCDQRCVAHVGDRVALARAARRSMAFARRVLGAVAAGEALAEPATVRACARGILTALGVHVEHLGGPLSAPTGPAGPSSAPQPGATAYPAAPGGPGTLVVANHISWLDVIALLAVEPVTMLAKREVGEWPMVGALTQRAGTRFIDRDSVRGLPDTVAEIAELLRGGRSVMVFPQGATWCAGTTGDFRRATFQAALDAGAPVRPVTLSYFQHHALSTVAAFVGDDDFGSSLRRIMSADGVSARVQVHEAIPAGTARDRRELAALAREAVRDAGPTTADRARADADATGVRGAACGRDVPHVVESARGVEIGCGAEAAAGAARTPLSVIRRPRTPLAQREASSARAGRQRR
ncbi:lysophospholipid acyltransferase family protein [Streptomyces sp. NPDC057702]|uniref:lysophospholipid acyltransferase family protein n=1 Tax=unclassified Streptomyces TaxID=2593676 RepID=UPI003684B47E